MWWEEAGRAGGGPRVHRGLCRADQAEGWKERHRLALGPGPLRRKQVWPEKPEKIMGGTWSDRALQAV